MDSIGDFGRSMSTKTSGHESPGQMTLASWTLEQHEQHAYGL